MMNISNNFLAGRDLSQRFSGKNSTYLSGDTNNFTTHIQTGQRNWNGSWLVWNARNNETKS